MTSLEMKALADGLVPVISRAVKDARAEDLKTIAALEMRILELETRPTVVGPQGERGLMGERGERGAPGEAGAHGAQGERGLQGEAGAPGSQGERGLPGERGPEGAPGPTGLMGPAGPAGADGTMGVQGERGQAGEKGEAADPKVLEGLNAAIKGLTDRIVTVEGKTLLAHRLESDVKTAMARLGAFETRSLADPDEIPAADVTAVFLELLSAEMTCQPGS